MPGVASHLTLLAYGWVLWFGAAVAGGWRDFSFGWKLNWRLLVDLMVHKEFDSQYNGSSSMGDGVPAHNGTNGLTLLDLMLRLNSVQEEEREG